MRKIKQKADYLRRVIHIFRGLSIIQWYYLVHFCDTNRESRLKTLKLRGFVVKEITVRSNSSDVWLTANLLVGRQKEGFEGDYDKVIEIVEMNFAPEGKINVIDAGANIGLFALLVKNRYPDADVYLIEPDKDNYMLLKKNMSKLSGIHLFEAGLWYKDAYLEIINPEATDWSKRVAEVSDGEGIHAVTIDDIIEENNIDDISVVKMDIEGSEYYVFKYGSEKWIKRSRSIVIETHDKYVKGTDELVNETMEKNNFSKMTVGENQVFFKSNEHIRV